MSNNIGASSASSSAKKLAIKAELLRHLGTAEEMYQNREPSSVGKVLIVTMAIDSFMYHGKEPNLAMYEKLLKR